MTMSIRKPLPERSHHYWGMHIWPRDKKLGMRKGQSFCNYFVFTLPELFYATSEDDAEKHIQKYVKDYCL